MPVILCWAACQSRTTATHKTLTLDPAEIQKPWTGDLDGMIQRQLIRVLTITSKTFYFMDKGVQFSGNCTMAEL